MTRVASLATLIGSLGVTPGSHLAYVIAKFSALALTPSPRSNSEIHSYHHVARYVRYLPTHIHLVL